MISSGSTPNSFGTVIRVVVDPSLVWGSPSPSPPPPPPRSPVCAEILGCKGDLVRLAVRVKVNFYPENICAAWIMFAVKYRSVL